MTKIVSWNIDNFNLDKISSVNLAPYQNWMTRVVRYNGDNAGLTPLQLFVFAANNYPFNYQEANERQNFNTIVAVAVQNARASTTAGQTGLVYAQAFIVHLQTLPRQDSIDAIINFLNLIVTSAGAGRHSIEFYLNRIIQSFYKNFTIDYPFSAILAFASKISAGDNNAAILVAARAALAAPSEAGTRLNYIINNLVPHGANLPDIIVIFEVKSSSAVPRYNTIDGKGSTGLIALLEQLRLVNPNYCLVPAVRLGGAARDIEGTAVFYNNATLEFTGPQIWNGNAAANPPGPPANYNAVWNGALPNTPVNVPGIAAPVPTNQLAAQCQFQYGVNPIHFSTANDRPPMLLTFNERGGATRKIVLCAMHATQGNSAVGVNQISNINALRNLQPNEVAVILGDFNVNVLDAGLKHTAFNTLLTVDNYQMVFDGDAALTYPAPNGRDQKSFIASFIGRSLINRNGAKAYNGNIPGLDASAVDNILVSSGKAFTNAMILNRVIGVSNLYAVNSPLGANLTYGYHTPAAAPANIPPSIPVGTNAGQSPYGYLLSNSIDATRAGNGDGPRIIREGIDAEYREMIRGTSDHLALVVNI